MRSASMFLRIATVFLLMSLLFSCRKEIKKRDFKLRTETFYRVSPITPVPIEVNGTSYVAFANFPGGGEGTASHMGNISFYFNQLVYGTDPAGPPVGSVAAPIADVPGYPVTGAPLPLIQAGDFANLALLNTGLSIPQEVHGLIINNVIVNKKGDAVFMSAITGSGSTFPISPTRVGFNGKALITGGRGKFSRAVGEVDYEGSFNVNDANDAEFNADGWIDY